MARKCANCGKKIDLFHKGWTCKHPSCDISECKACKKKVLKDCPVCTKYFCQDHFINHGCEEEEMEEKDEPKKECIFQFDYDEEERKWNCGLTNEDIWCNKSKCPLWRDKNDKQIKEP